MLEAKDKGLVLFIFFFFFFKYERVEQSFLDAKVLISSEVPKHLI